jgi:Predicted metal-binding protein
MKCECGCEIKVPKFCSECGRPIQLKQVCEHESKLPNQAQGKVAGQYLEDATATNMLEEFPDSLTAKNISEHLQVTDAQVYKLMQKGVSIGGIPNFTIGKSRRTRKEDYIAWLASRPTNSRLKLAIKYGV